MTLRSLSDLVGLVLLMAVLEGLRRRHRDAAVQRWMLGLFFVLLGGIAVGVPGLGRGAQALALDFALLAGAAFGWAAGEDMFPGARRIPLLLPMMAPLLGLGTLYGLEVVTPRLAMALTAGTLLLGLILIPLVLQAGRAFRLSVLLVHAAIWMPMTWMAWAGELRLMVGWGLASVYLVAAGSFRRRVRRGAFGGLVIVAGFTVWGLCFLAGPFVLGNAFALQLQSMQTYFVVVGLILVLLEDQTSRLHLEAMHDPLTDLPNRRLFDDRLLQSMSRARRFGRSSAVFVIDLDNFKQINDTHGHRCGDLVLIRVGQMLKSRIRTTDTLARCGGDEFSVIVNDLNQPSDCERIAEALRNAVRGVELPEGMRPALSASVGYALYPDDAADPQELCDLADIRMYKEKRAGAPSRVRAQSLTMSG
jgi:diguanylate cyclase (GGDEF)-like protein